MTLVPEELCKGHPCPSIDESDHVLQRLLTRLEEMRPKALDMDQGPIVLKGQPACIEDAVKILGKENVITFEQSHGVWRNKSQVPRLRYSSKLLYEAIYKITNGEPWFLIYLNGFSLEKLLALRGVGSSNTKFHETSKWAMDDQSDYLCSNSQYEGNRSFEPGYYLIKFSDENSDYCWYCQEYFPENERRCHLNLVTEALLTMAMIGGREFPLSGSHWGTTTGQCSCYLTVESTSNGVVIDNSFFKHFGSSAYTFWEYDCPKN